MGRSDTDSIDDAGGVAVSGTDMADGTDSPSICSASATAAATSVSMSDRWAPSASQTAPSSSLEASL